MPLTGFTVDDGIAAVTLDSPRNRNALSRQMVEELAAHLAAAASDPAVRGLVLGASGTTFCAGADLTDPPDTSDLVALVEALWDFPSPVVARLNGHARAGGVGLVAAADVVVAPLDATFAFSEVRVGVAPAMIAVVCIRRMSPRALSRYMLTGEVFDAVAAVDLGLVTIAAALDEVAAITDTILDAIRLGEPGAIEATKELLRVLPQRTVADGFAHAAGVSAALFSSPAAAEGRRAFQEKRPPSWASGRAAATG